MLLCLNDDCRYTEFLYVDAKKNCAKCHFVVCHYVVEVIQISYIILIGIMLSIITRSVLC